MPPPFPVRLVAHDPGWATQANAAAAALLEHVPALIAVYHVGSTAVPGLLAKPVIDLLPVATALAALDAQRATLERLGYRWHGPLGLAGRRYCTLDAPDGERRIQLHCFAHGSSAIRRHLAFRDQLRRSPAHAAAYQAEKQRCALLHPEDSHAYADCKGGWIARAEAEALTSPELAATLRRGQHPRP